MHKAYLEVFCALGKVFAQVTDDVIQLSAPKIHKKTEKLWQ